MLLSKLQEIDLVILELEQNRNSASSTCLKLEKELFGLNEKLVKEKKVVEEKEIRLRKDEGELDVEKTNLKKWKARLNDSRNSRDSIMLVREIDSHEKMIRHMEEILLELMETVESAKKNISTLESDANVLKDKLEKTSKESQEKLRDIEKQVTALREERVQYTSKISPEFLSRYDFIRSKRMGYAVMPVKNGICTGCHMAISPRLYTVLIKNVTRETCPSCQRIIYTEEILAGQNEESA